MAAVEAAKYGLKVTLVDKGKFSRSGSTPVAASAFSSPRGAGDSEELFFADILRVGEDLCDQNLAAVCVEESLGMCQKLESLGVPLEKTPDGNLHISRAMGHSLPREVHFGFEISDPLAVLRREAAQRGVRIIDFVMITEILTANGRAVGAIGLDRQGNVLRFLARAVIIGAGSATALYPRSSAIFNTTGDAVALGLNAGTTVVDLEFVELTLVPVLDGTVLTTGGIGTMVRTGAAYLNNRGERFMEKIDPVKKEAAPRYQVVRALYQEIKEGRGPVICDLSSVPPEVAQGPSMGNIVLIHKRAAAGLGATRQQFEWGIAIHRLLGGNRINADASTSVPGLYAIGESAGGVHGAGRLAGMAVLDCLVFGTRAGRAACQFAAETDPPGPDQAMPTELSQPGRTSVRPGMSADDLIAQVQDTMGEYVSVVRDGAGLTTAVGKLEEILATSADVVSDNPWRPFEARNLALNAYLISRAALTRCESRGGHVREDFPARDDANWLKHIGFTRRDGAIKMDYVPVRGKDGRP